MSTPGKANLITDVSGLRVGCADDATALTGTTVVLADTPAVAAVAVAGGGPGTRETDLLAAGTLVEAVDAVVLSGGSAYGLAAADGVAAALGAAGRGFGLVEDPNVPKTPIVPAAILYDLNNGGDKAWGDRPPYEALGREALRRADGTFDLGSSGAGLGARAGKARGGLGSASIVTDDGLTVGALAAVNSFGSVYMPGTDVFWAWPYEIDGEFGRARPPADYRADAEDWGAAKANPAPGQNTTIACIATDVSLSASQAQRVAQMALSGFSRAIRPVFAPFDGDAVFVLSTGKQPLPDPVAFSLARLGELAASTLARAIARGVWEAARQDSGLSV
ncbi:MAG: P1 family peptidase [Henriciella sp.]|nr:P1 family peptidase [Henriciella sp.]